MSLNQVLTPIHKLDQLILPDSGYLIDTPAVPMGYCYINNLNLADDKIYNPNQAAVAYLSKETISMSKLKDNLELGHRFLAMLYSYRSVARGIPQANNQDQANRPEMYKLSYELLKPEINKIKDLQRYCEECTSTVLAVFKTMAPEYKEGFPSSEFLIIIARTLDLILVIDALKNAKASLNNDFSIYKRISSNLKSLVPDMEDETVEHHLLYTFLATQNVFASKIKDKLAEASGFDDILVDMVNTCATMFENQLFVKPDEKHMLLKAIAFGLFLLDMPSESLDITKNKRLKLDRFGKILKSNPVVPFFGDMTMSLTTLFIKTPKLSQQRWEFDPNDESLSRNYLLSYKIDSIRMEFKSYVQALTALKNMSKMTFNKNEAFSADDCLNIYEMLLRGIQLLSSMTCRVLEQNAWKYTNPTNSQKNPACPQDAKLYEMAVRYNYTVEERLILCEVIGFIKTLAHHLSTFPGYLFEAVQKHIYLTVQAFVRTTLRDMISHVGKKKKPVLAVIQHLHSIMTDKFGPEVEDSGKNKSSTAGINPKAAGVALTQYHYIRVLLDAVTNEKAKGMQGGFLKEKDFKDNHVVETGDFLNKIFYFPAMLCYLETVRECSDLAELWYREFYLELTKEIQFPIEMSLPWIITDTNLEAEYQPCLEYVLSPFDVYNDAANRALHRLKSRFLYDEIEAEVNLCFDQFIFKISHKIYSTFRIMASSILLDKSYSRDLEARLMAKDGRHDFELTLYTTILRQKRFHMLGRYVDIGKLIGQFCNQQLRSSVDYAISRFEASDFTGIFELEKLLECTRLTHKLIGEHLELDSIDDILAECDESLSLITFNGRIVSHVIQELVLDVFPNFCYNQVTQRFVPTAVMTNEQVTRAPMPKTVPLYMFGSKQLNAAFSNHISAYKEFIGSPHLLSLMHLIDFAHLPVIIGECCQAMEAVIKGTLGPYCKALTKGLPHSTKLPPFDYGPRGAFDYFQLILKPLLGYKDLKSGVFQSFQELGNSIVFFLLVESVLKTHFTLDLVQFSPLVGFTSTILDSKLDSKFSAAKILDSANNAIEVKGSAVNFRQLSNDLTKLYQNKRDYNVLGAYLHGISKIFADVRGDWEPVPIGKEEIAVDHSTEFARLWSSLLFAFSIPPPSQTEYSNRSLYGDGFLWSGTAIVYFFQEQKRFKAFDFISFLSYLNSVDKTGAAQKGPSGIVDLNRFFQICDYNLTLVNDAFETIDYAIKRPLSKPNQ